MSSICLNMIVRNEGKVIQSCLKSVKPFIDYWVIVDTGSTDKTKEIIRKTLAGIPGELHETSWSNFAHNRNIALDLAKDKADYLLFIDADERLVSFYPPSWESDCYLASFKLENNALVQRILLAKADLDWKWKGAVHEELTPPFEVKGEVLYSALVEVSQKGHRSQDPQKLLKDAMLLEKELESDPDNSRLVFYLAISYDSAGKDAAALKNFKRRATMGGWDEEIFYSLYRIGCLEEKMGAKEAEFTKSYSLAYANRPTRAEPLFRLANYYSQKKLTLLAYLTTKFALPMPCPKDAAFVEKTIYDYEFLTLWVNSAYTLGFYDEAMGACRLLQYVRSLPDSQRKRVDQVLEAFNQLK